MKQCDKLNRLPKEVQGGVLEALKGWTRCYVEKYNDGHYQVSLTISLTKHDQIFEAVISFENYEVYTREEIVKHAKEFWAGVNMSEW